MIQPLHDPIYQLEILHRRSLSPRVFELELRRPSCFEYYPGQFIRVFFGSQARDYSILSAPQEETIRLCLAVISPTGVAARLARISRGARVEVSGPHGHFLFRPSRRPAAFIAAGTGVGPFVSMVRAGVRGFWMVQGARTGAGLYYRQELQAAASRYVGCLTREPIQEFWGFSGRVTGFLQGSFPPGQYDFYLCGGARMIRDVTHLVDEHYKGSSIYTESFS